MKSICVIPARYGSTRFPGKPLVFLGGKPLIQWVYEKALEAGCFDRIIIATDDTRIQQVSRKLGAETVLTDQGIRSGTDRVWAAVSNMDFDIVVNLQGDEPFIPPSLLQSIVGTFEPEADIITPARKAMNLNEVKSKNTAKIVIDRNNYALYFSRAPIPASKDQGMGKASSYLIHIGIYAFKKDSLSRFVHFPSPGMEKIESLEQLRALYNGLKIKVLLTDYSGVSIDTPEDLRKAEKMIKEM